MLENLVLFTAVFCEIGEFFCQERSDMVSSQKKEIEKMKVMFEAKMMELSAENDKLKEQLDQVVLPLNSNFRKQITKYIEIPIFVFYTFELEVSIVSYCKKEFRQRLIGIKTKLVAPIFPHFLPHIFVPTIENGEELCIRVCFSFLFVVSTQNQLPQIIIRLGCVIYHIKACLVVVRTT